MTKKNIGKSQWILYLIALYAGVVFVRYILALITSSFPTVGIDEYLYYSLARSIATKGSLVFRGQSADYAYVLYPLVISPVYLLFQNGAAFYRMLQLWNIMLMSASVFPLFYLSSELIGSEKKAMLATALSMLLPDFYLSELIFSEAIIYPIFFSLMYCAYLYAARNKTGCIFLAGLLGGLLYSTKPGTVAPTAVFLVGAAVLAIVRKKPKDVLFAVLSAMILLATACAFWALARFAFGYDGSLFSIYASQLDGTAESSTAMFFKALALYPCYFIMASGLVGVVYPAVTWTKWQKEKKLFWWFVIAALTVMMVGSAWAVEQVSKLNNIHLRYIAMYIPLFLLFCFIPTEPVKKTKKYLPPKENHIPVWIILGYVAVCILAFGSKAKSQTEYIHPMASLSVLNDKIVPLSGQWIADVVILMLCACAALLFIIKSPKKRTGTVSIVLMTVCMLANGLIGYKLTRDEVYYPKLEEDGRKAVEMTQGEPYIYLLTTEGVADMGVDVNNKQNNCVVYTNDFINCLQANNGVYVPYVPEQTRGMKSVSETPDVNMLVIDYDSFPFIQLSPYAAAASPFDRGTVYIVRFTEGKRIVDSTLSNLTRKVLLPGNPGIILCYNEESFGKPVTIGIEIESGSAQKLTIHSTHEQYTVELSEGKDWYEVTFKSAEDAYNFFTTESAIKVHAYRISAEG